jgi:hypothetical protein
MAILCRRQQLAVLRRSRKVPDISVRSYQTFERFDRL